ncbi:LuxR C-terminal-related transcriptional regulator [Candidatus Pacearchaeota archaeon]|jgi:DNA-binding CsgD family transcriptional regulator|nr:LuxR C-terminal-related transcriptional regulator [Candidatus Pacearchaeota archaeon]
MELIMGRKTNRSNGYQHLFAEQPYSNEMMAEFSEAQGLVENYNPEDREQLLVLREKLRGEFWRLAKENLTERQFQVIELLAKGYTQIEIAKQLNVNQSSITKSVNGNCDYKNGRRIYGGAKKKLRRLADKDPQIQEIITQIADIHSQYN